MATAAIKLRAEVACKLCRSVAVKTKGQWLIAKSQLNLWTLKLKRNSQSGSGAQSSLR